MLTTILHNEQKQSRAERCKAQLVVLCWNFLTVTATKEKDAPGSPGHNSQQQSRAAAAAAPASVDIDSNFISRILFHSARTLTMLDFIPTACAINPAWNKSFVCWEGKREREKNERIHARPGIQY